MDEQEIIGGYHFKMIPVSFDVWWSYGDAESIEVEGPLRAIALAAKFPYMHGPTVTNYRESPNKRRYRTEDIDEHVDTIGDDWDEYCGAMVCVPELEHDQMWFHLNSDVFMSESAARRHAEQSQKYAMPRTQQQNGKAI